MGYPDQSSGRHRSTFAFCSGSGSSLVLRMDEEIMDFQWFEHVTWESIKDMRGTTCVQLPTRFKFALQQAHHAILCDIIHSNPSSLASESAWKALEFSSWLLLRRLAINASESKLCTLFGCTELFHFGPWCVPNVMLLQCRMPHTEQLHSRSSHEYAKLLHQHVLVKKDEPWQSPETHYQSQSQSDCLRDQESLSRRPGTSCCCPGIWVGTFPVRSCRAHPHHTPKKCHDSVNQDQSACARNIGLTHWQGTATCFCK